MASHSSTLAWKIPWTEDPGGLPPVGSHRVGHDWSDLAAAAAATSGSLELSGNQTVFLHIHSPTPVEDHVTSIPLSLSLQHLFSHFSLSVSDLVSYFIEKIEGSRREKELPKAPTTKSVTLENVCFLSKGNHSNSSLDPYPLFLLKGIAITILRPSQSFFLLYHIILFSEQTCLFLNFFKF